MMIEYEPRIPPLDRASWTDDARDVFAVLGGAEQWESGPSYQIIGIFAQHPSLMRRYLGFARQLLMDSVLPTRARELLILHIGWTCKSPYEWLSHVREGLRAGLSPEDIDGVKEGPDSSRWSDLERNMMRAADQILNAYDIDNELWAALSRELDYRQLMELLFAIGNYAMLSGVVNALRIPPEAGPDGEDLIRDFGTP